MTDAELVCDTLKGRKDAYAELARRWAPRLMAICHARVRRQDVAEDLTQESLLRGFRSLNTLSDPAKVGTWLMGIAVRAALDWLKASERKTVSFTNLGGESSLDERLPQPELPSGIEPDERQLLIREVESLPEVYRQVVMLYYYDELTYRDLANLLNVSTATINARLTKARSLLRNKLTQCRSEIR
jgi:RNA polymerase sigma-70 factor (ECF subfamily)